MEIQGDRVSGLPSEPLLDVVIDNFKKNEENILLLDPHNGTEFTYSEIFERSCKVAWNLNKLGIGKGDIVSAASENTAVGISIFFGTWFSGATFNPFNSNLTQTEIELMFGITKPRLVYCGQHNQAVEGALVEAASEALLLNYLKFESEALSYSEWMESEILDFEPEREDSLSHILCVLFTSGTTGAPKGIKLSAEGFKAVCHLASSFQEGKNLVLTTPMFWISSISLILQTVYYSGTAIIPRDLRDTEGLLQAITNYKPEDLFLGPTGLLRMCEVPNIEDYDLSSIKSITSGGAMFSILKRRYVNEKLFNNKIFVKMVYGSTEAGFITTWPEDLDITTDEYNSVGCVAEGAFMKFIDVETGDTLGPYEEGEICVKTLSLLAGMILPSGETVSGLDGDGWFHTGDLGFFDKKWFVYIVGRLKDILKYSGFQIAPAEIESVIQELPEVLEVSVTGKSDPVYGDLPAAFIVKKEDSPLTEEEVINFVAERVVDHKQLRGGVYFLEELPKNAVGKVLNKDLQNLLNSE